MLTKEGLEAIKERCEKATEGSWESALKDPEHRSFVVGSFHKGVTIVADVANEHDADFISHARQDILRLIAEVESLCPIGDLDIVNSLKAENKYLTEVIKEKDEEIESTLYDINKIKEITNEYQ